MKLILTTCYSHFMYFMLSGETVQDCVYKVECGSPQFQHEGVSGYIETEITLYIKDLTKFSRLWDKWYELPAEERNRIYSLVKAGRKYV